MNAAAYKSPAAVPWLVAPSHVLVPLDGWPLAEAALSHALDVFDCRVTVPNVVTPLGSDMRKAGYGKPMTNGSPTHGSGPNACSNGLERTIR